MNMKFNEKLFKRNRIYAGRAVNFSVDEILLPNGKKATREYLEHPGAVTILPFIDKNNIILVKQYRFPVKKLTYELPAGKIDAGESIISCVKRELVEETGYYAKKVKKIFSFWPTSAFSNEVIHIYHAENLIIASKCPDDDEFIEHLVIPFKKALEWVKNGRIRDSKTVIALLFWANK